jgi:hypothetical protein
MVKVKGTYHIFVKGTYYMFVKGTYHMFVNCTYRRFVVQADTLGLLDNTAGNLYRTRLDSAL